MSWISYTISIICLVYVILPIVAFIILAIYGFRKISQPAFDKILEFGKWYLVSVALVLSAQLVKDGITERETGIKEMESFKEYTETVINGGIEKRWELSKYFAHVTPTTRLKDGWIGYMNSIEADYIEFKNGPKRVDSIKRDSSLTEAQRSQAIFSEADKRAEQATPIASKTNVANEDWVIILTADKDLVAAQHEQTNAGKLAYLSSPRIIKVGDNFLTISQSYASREIAKSALEILQKYFTTGPYIVRLSEICPNLQIGSGYSECK